MPNPNKTVVDYDNLVVKKNYPRKTLIAPVEVSPAEAAHVAGTQLIYNDALYNVLTDIAIGDTLTTEGAGANISAADSVTAQIKNLTTENEALTKEVTDAYALMGRNGAKNHVHVTAISQTINGVTFTVNDDGSIKANGTATEFTAFDIETTATGLKAVSGNYLLSDGLANPSASHYTTITVVDKNDVTTYDYANTKDAGKQAFSIVAEDIKSIYLAVCIGANVTVNDLVFYPMVRDAEDIDSDFQPYAKTNQQLTAENQTLTNNLSDEVKTRAKLGAKNVFNPNLSTIATSANYYPNTSVTVGSDKQITVDSTSDAGGSYSYKNIALANNDSFNLEKGIEYIISGLETDNNATYFALFRAYDSSNNEILSITVGSTEASFTLPSNTATYNLVLCVGRTVSLSKTFYVMFRLATDSDPTYQPYAMTNRELTESVNGLKMKHIVKQITLTANDTTILDLSSDFALPSGSKIQSLQLALSADNTINSSSMPLPYCHLSTGDVQTWMERFNPNGSNIKIINRTSEWTNYYLHAVAFYT